MRAIKSGTFKSVKCLMGNITAEFAILMHRQSVGKSELFVIEFEKESWIFLLRSEKKVIIFVQYSFFHCYSLWNVTYRN